MSCRGRAQPAVERLRHGQSHLADLADLADLAADLAAELGGEAGVARRGLDRVDPHAHHRPRPAQRVHQRSRRLRSRRLRRGGRAGRPHAA
eukprot:3541564-Prymnesium_polylepis.1